MISKELLSCLLRVMEVKKVGCRECFTWEGVNSLKYLSASLEESASLSVWFPKINIYNENVLQTAHGVWDKFYFCISEQILLLCL